MSDFNIENGILKKYTGKDADVVIPDGVTEIGDHAFSGCSGLTSITIPDSVMKIGESAFFWGYDKLSKVHISDLAKWCDIKFDGYCSNPLECAHNLYLNGEHVTDLVIPDGVTKIDGYTFHDCTGLTSITIPDSVTEIGDCAFYGCSSLTSVTIPDSVTKIGSYAFRDCSSLTSVTIPDGVTEIGGGAFYDCSGLTNVTIPDSVTEIGGFAFCDCTGLTNVTISAGVTKIDNSAFSDCSSLASVTIPDSVTKIDHSAFSGCRSLTSVTIPDSVTEICVSAFWDCSSLASVTIPDGVTEICDSAFWGCSSLAGVTIPDSVTKIGDQAFAVCTSLTSVMIPDSVAEIGDYAFYDCSSLASIVAAENNNVYHSAGNCLIETGSKKLLFGCKTSVIPDDGSVTKISKGAFRGCSSLTSVKIPDGVTEIGDCAFEDCSGLTNVTIPDSVTEIGWGAFSHCSGLTSITIPDSVTKIGDNAFSGCKRLKTVVLPAGKDLLWFAEETGNFYPLCYSATEEQMADAIKEAAKWKKNKKEAFYEAYLVSDTRAAMLLAEKRKELDKYAKMRGMTADEVRDSMLSDLGLDAEGCKAYDLGNMTVNVRMLSDFTFTVELPDGKASKSIPKKDADEKKYEEANKDFSEIKKNVKKIWKNRSDVILSDFITGKEREASYWIKTYSGNPVLRHIACLIVWEQNGAYFTKTKDGTVDAEGAPYELGEGTVRVAHPMEMSAEEVSAWQKYFTDRVLKQPFAQIWERVYKPEDISEDRYRDCPILFFALQGAGKHGFDKKLKISGCKVKTEWTSEKAPNGNSVSYCNITSFRIGKYSRAVNHAIAYLDRITVLGRIAKDDISVMDYVEGCNAAQITDYTDAANNAKATNVLAALLEYKNKNFPDATPFDVFTLDW